MPKANEIPHVKTVRSKGRTYYYFNTGVRNPKGVPIYKRLPDIRADHFGDVYAAYKAGRTKRESVDPTLTIEQFIGLFESSPKFQSYAKGTQRVYSINLRRIEANFPEAPAEEIDSTDIARLLASLGTNVGAANLALSVVGSLYKWGRTKKVIHKKCDPTEGLEHEKMGEHEPWPEHILDAALECDKERVKLATHLLFYTGQRIGDVCAMRWTDIRDGRLEVRQKKTGKELSIPLHAELAALLDTTPRRALTILSTHDGRPLTDGTIRTELQAFVKERFKLHIVPHGLRKNAVNAILEAGCSTAETSSVTGQSLQMVEHYAKKRNQKRLSSAAILQWEKAERNVR